jgi:ABC-type nitrate/sulfonate/bicarbonate transport system permease component
VIESLHVPAASDAARLAPASPTRTVLRARSLGRLGRRLGLAVAGVALLVAVWALIASATDPLRLPTPGTVWETLRADWVTVPALEFVAFQAGGIRDALLHTTINVILGVAIGASCGFVVGAVLGRWRTARELLQIPLLVLSTMPVLVLLPFLLQWFGTARIVQSGLVIVFAFVTVAGVVQQATREVGSRYGDYASTLGAGERRIVFSVLLPGALPATVGAVRVAAAAGWSFAAVAELLGGQAGTGKLIQAMQGLSATPDIMATVLAVGVAALILDAAIAAAGGFVVRWKD